MDSGLCLALPQLVCVLSDKVIRCSHSKLEPSILLNSNISYEEDLRIDVWNKVWKFFFVNLRDAAHHYLLNYPNSFFVNI